MKIGDIYTRVEEYRNPIGRNDITIISFNAVGVQFKGLMHTNRSLSHTAFHYFYEPLNKPDIFDDDLFIL